MSTLTPSPATSGTIRVYRVNGETGEPSVGEGVEVWEIRPGRHRYIGIGRLVGFIRRARAEDDVRLPIVERTDRNEYLPSYPGCPDCGGALGTGTLWPVWPSIHVA